MYTIVIGFAWANQRHCQCFICHTARFTRGTRYTARHVITVTVLAFLTADKMQSTINQLKHRKGCAVRVIMVLGVVSIDHYCAYGTFFRALTNTCCMLNRNTVNSMYATESDD